MIEKRDRNLKKRTEISGNDFEFRHPTASFTVLELLIVITIIIVLAGLILATSGYVQKKGARSRAEAEIAAMSAACESYKADNGIYPTNQDTGMLDPIKDVDSASLNATKYSSASLGLYKAISGDSNANSNRSPAQKSYFAFKPNMLMPSGGIGSVTAIRDPFGNSYGYSTMKAGGGTDGYNPTFDLWSTGSSTDPNQWIRNW